MKALVFIGFLACFASQAFAHPGHDHSFWASDAIHALFLLAIIVAAVLAGFCLSKKNQNTSLENQENK